MRTFGMWSYRHPVVVVLLWVLAIGGVQIAAGVIGTDYRNSFALPGTDSQAAVDLLDERFAAASGDADTLVVRSAMGSVNDPDVRAEVDALLAEVAGIDSVIAVRSPYGPMGAGQISEDGTVAYASVQYATAGIEVPRTDLEALTGLVDDAATDTLEVSVGGQGVAALSTPEVGAGELIGVAFAALVLFVAFRSVVAMALPIVSAAAALGVAVGLVRLGSNVATISDVAPVLGILLGLGVGIDYALFILNRHRMNLRTGMRLRESVATALDTSGRAVAFAGVTVVIALAGLFVTGIEFLYGMAVAASISVVFTVLAAGTLLPALLRLAGRRVLSRADRRALDTGRLEHNPASPGFTRWANLVARRPATLVLIAVAVLGVVAYPASDLRLGTADQGNDAAGTTTRQA
ncbi:MMPL family transporter, partial [Georgenia sp.]